MDRNLAVIVAMSLLAAPTMASAGLIGSDVNVHYFFGTSSNPASFDCSSGSATVGDEIEYPTGCSGFSHISIDITDDQVFVTNSQGAWTGRVLFNGFVMSILPGGPSILSATFISGPMDGDMGPSLLVDASSVSFNFVLPPLFAGLPGGTSIFDIETASVSDDTTPVPEPATLALLGLGLVGLGFSRRRKA